MEIVPEIGSNGGAVDNVSASESMSETGNASIVKIPFRLPRRLFGNNTEKNKNPSRLILKCIDCHCGGEPARVVLSGMPSLPNDCSRASSKRTWIETNRRFDHLRKALLSKGNPSQNVDFVFPPCFNHNYDHNYNHDEDSDSNGELNSGNNENENAYNYVRGDDAWQYVTGEAQQLQLQEPHPHTKKRRDSNNTSNYCYYPSVSVHDTVCVATVLLECGVIPMEEPVCRFDLEGPTGPIAITARCRDGTAQSIAFEHPPSFVEHRDVPVLVPSSDHHPKSGRNKNNNGGNHANRRREPGLFAVDVDMVYCGMWYCLVDLSQFRRGESRSQNRQQQQQRPLRGHQKNNQSTFPKLRIDPGCGEELCRIAERIRVACFEQLPVDCNGGGGIQQPAQRQHSSALAFWDSDKTRFEDSTNSLVMNCWDDLLSSSVSWKTSMIGDPNRRLFGKGTAAIMTVLYDRGLLGIGETFHHHGLFGSKVTGTVLGTTDRAPGPNGSTKKKTQAILPRIQGSARITQYSQVVIRESYDGDEDCLPRSLLHSPALRGEDSDNRNSDNNNSNNNIEKSLQTGPALFPSDQTGAVTAPVYKAPHSEHQHNTFENTFYYDGGYYYVPKNFTFPKVTIREGLSFWFKGQRVAIDPATNAVDANSATKKLVRPFRDLLWKYIPDKRVKKAYSLEWSNLFKYLEEGVDAKPLPPTATEAEIDRYYELVKEVLKTKVSYYYQDGRSLKNMISSWSTKIQRSSILKSGTPSDIAQLPEATLRNKPRTTNDGRVLRRRGRLKESPKFPDRQEKRLKKLNRLPELAALNRNSPVGGGGGGNDDNNNHNNNNNNNNKDTKAIRPEEKREDMRIDYLYRSWNWQE